MRVRTEKEYVKKINNPSTKIKISARSSLEVLWFTGIPSFPFIFEVRPTLSL